MFITPDLLNILYFSWAYKPTNRSGDHHRGTVKFTPGERSRHRWGDLRMVRRGQWSKKSRCKKISGNESSNNIYIICIYIYIYLYIYTYNYIYIYIYMCLSSKHDLNMWIRSSKMEFLHHLDHLASWRIWWKVLRICRTYQDYHMIQDYQTLLTIINHYHQWCY